MFPQAPATEQIKPDLSWIEVAYPKGQLHPTNAPEIRARYTWGVFLDVAAMQLAEYEKEHDKAWIPSILETLTEINRLGALYGRVHWEANPARNWPLSLAHVVNGAISFGQLIRKLETLFGNVTSADIMKTN